MRPVHLLLVVPGTAFWTLVFIGVATGNTMVWIAAAVFGVATAGGFAAISVRKNASDKAARRRAWTHGIPATATVVSARTDGSIHNHPYVVMTLDVSVPDQLPRRVEIRQAVSQLLVSGIEPGKVIGVRVDRDDPVVVVIDEALTPFGY